MGTYLKSRTIFLKISVIINTLFPTLRESLCAGRAKIFAEAPELFMHASFSARRRQVNRALVVRPSGVQKY